MMFALWMPTSCYFYPRPPRGGRQGSASNDKFNYYFYPRPPRGGRPSDAYQTYLDKIISIHALREEGDIFPARSMIIPSRFLSTPSARRATV